MSATSKIEWKCDKCERRLLVDGRIDLDTTPPSGWTVVHIGYRYVLCGVCRVKLTVFVNNEKA